MRIYYDGQSAFLQYDGKLYSRGISSWDTLINRKKLYQFLLEDLDNWTPMTGAMTVEVLPPIGSQEVWAAGVTYMRSKTARMEEAEQAGGGEFYDRVYDADRPELFMKATADRVVGPGGTVLIRRDSSWNVPEPELTLFISSQGTIEGYTIGNDMSSRSIEGENPLYLPQAKVYDNCAALGPCIYVTREPIDRIPGISMEIFRNGEAVFEGSIAIDQIKRDLEDLVLYLYRECTFPQGCFLMTGTGIVPPDEFTLKVDDEIRIHIDSIGTLVNKVGMKPL